MPGEAVPPAPGFRLPPARHTSMHEVTFDGATLGAYRLRIYRGQSGLVVVFDEAPDSDLPLESFSLKAAGRVVDVLGDPHTRLFEHHHRSGGEVWVEIEVAETAAGRYLARATAGGPEKLLDALGKEAFADAFESRRRRIDQGR